MKPRRGTCIRGVPSSQQADSYSKRVSRSSVAHSQTLVTKGKVDKRWSAYVRIFECLLPFNAATCARPTTAKSKLSAG